MIDVKTEAEYRESLVKHLLPPKGYDIDLAEWRRVLKHDAESFGCDWLEWFMNAQGGNVVSRSVQDMAERQAQLVAVAKADENRALKKENERMRKALEDIRQWDMLDTTDDGGYWKVLIDKALASVASEKEKG